MCVDVCLHTLASMHAHARMHTTTHANMHAYTLTHTRTTQFSRDCCLLLGALPSSLEDSTNGHGPVRAGLLGNRSVSHFVQLFASV